MFINIMLVDDSAICNLIMKKVLSRLSSELEIFDFTDPVLAFSQIGTVNPAIIFLDLNMPELDGWGFLERMQQMEQRNQVIVLTSSTSELDRGRCVEFSNILAYHVKPITQSLAGTLLQMIQAQAPLA